jgi:hypothetical protein
MKKNPFLMRMMAISIIGIITWLFWPSIPQPITTENEQVIKLSEIKKISLPVDKVTRNIPLPVITKNITSNDSATLVSKAYAAELTFPPYSQPLTDRDFDRLKPNHFNPQSIPIDDVGNEVTASLSKYRYIYPEPVLATLEGENIDNAELQLVDISTGELILTQIFEKGEVNWHAQFEGKKNLPPQLQATIKAFVNGKIVSIVLALKYVDSVATLEYFDSAFNHDADMVLKANLTVREQGLYRVRANLFDANQQPIAHLVSKDKLNKGNSHIDLKAHQSVLRGKKTPFYLSTFSIELMSPAPGKPTKYGHSAIKKYTIKSFALSSLNEVPYQPSEHEKQRLLLLQNMAKRK